MTHGSTWSYRKGCRCEPCRHRWNEQTRHYMALYRARKKAAK